MFYDRQDELASLDRWYKGPGAQLVVVYGRRRVGKTALLRRFVADRPHIYYLADLSSEKEQLAAFSERVYQLTKDPVLVDNPFSNWSALFAYLAKLAIRKRLIVVIDEYQYLQSANKALSSIIQKAWDEQLEKSSIFLILCGSYVSFMENELLAYKSPLYGRRTGQLFIRPLAFAQALHFFPDLSMEMKVDAYGILGGLPAYLKQFSTIRSIRSGIVNKILQPDSFLFNEPQFVLMQELREPRNYFAILKAIAQGRTRLNEIVQTSGLERGIVTKYLEILRNLRLVEREVPVQEERPEKSRKGIYRISDNFFRFWFRFVFPNLGLLEERRGEYVLQTRIWPYLGQYMGPVFEDVCREYLRWLNLRARIPFNIFRMGRFWSGETEIDLVGFDEKRETLLVVECKWTNKKVGINVFQALKAKAQGPYFNRAKHIYYALCTKRGFTPGLLREKPPNLLLFSLEDMILAWKQ